MSGPVSRTGAVSRSLPTASTGGSLQKMSVVFSEMVEAIATEENHELHEYTLIVRGLSIKNSSPGEIPELLKVAKMLRFTKALEAALMSSDQFSSIAFSLGTVSF